MKKPTGLGAWVAFGSVAEKRWKTVGGGGMIDVMAECGVSWVAPRAGDRAWNDGHFDKARMERLIDAAHGHGMTVHPWIYVRPTDNFTRYAADAKRLIDAGADGFIINAEVEWKGNVGQAAVKGLCDALRKALPDTHISHAPLAWIAYHQDFPYKEFGYFTDAVMPQTYWTELVRGSYKEMADKCLPEWDRLEREGRVEARGYAPIGVTYGSDEVKGVKVPPPGKFKPEDLAAFLDRYKSLHCVSLYGFEFSADSAIQLLKQRHALSEHTRDAFSGLQPVTPIENNTAPPFYEWVGLDECVSYEGALATTGVRDELAWRKLGELYEKEFGVKPK